MLFFYWQVSKLGWEGQLSGEQHVAERSRTSY